MRQEVCAAEEEDEEDEEDEEEECIQTEKGQRQSGSKSSPRLLHESPRCAEPLSAERCLWCGRERISRLLRTHAMRQVSSERWWRGAQGPAKIFLHPVSVRPGYQFFLGHVTGRVMERTI